MPQMLSNTKVYGIIVNKYEVPRRWAGAPRKETSSGKDGEAMAELNEKMCKDISKQIESRLKDLSEQVEIPL